MKKDNYQIREYDDFKNMDKFSVPYSCKTLLFARRLMVRVCEGLKNGSFALIEISEENEIILQKIENTF